MRNPHQKDRLILLIHTHSAVQGQAPPAANGSYFNPSAGRRRCFGGGKARPPSLDAGEIALFPLLVPPLDPLVRANAVHEAARLPGSKKYGNGGAAMSIRAKANISGTCERAAKSQYGRRACKSRCPGPSSGTGSTRCSGSSSAATGSCWGTAGRT